jgi:squalene-hopene/tetraprenyl-beta-curcumene cyclase
MRTTSVRLMVIAVSVMWVAHARGEVLDWREKAGAMAEKAAAFLKSKQDGPSGGWSVNPRGPTFPAVTGLVLEGLCVENTLDENDPVIAKGVAFVLSKRQPDGGIYDNVLPSYNTAICLTALSRAKSAEARKAIKPAQDFLQSLQYGEGAEDKDGRAESATKVGRSHPFYGGIGYGNRGRPDLSNLSFALEGLRASGVDPSSPAFERALVFLSRVQMHEKVNDQPYAKGSTQGGFIYATSEDKEKVGTGQSFAGTIEETLSDGTRASRLRAYGSMTYAGFKSYAYANLSKDDPRVVLAREWISKNYTLAENPGVGTDGVYYYFLMFAKAMSAWGDPTIEVEHSDGTRSVRDWGEDLVNRLAELQQDDGSFKVVDDRWMENDPVLITAYSLTALRCATR